MASGTRYLRIGMFVLIGAGAFLALGILIGLNRIHRTTIAYYTYFDEAVTGLEVGSPVRARGVPIGQVGDITFAPDHRMIEVRSDLDVGELERLGLRMRDDRSSPNVPANLRAQLASQGLTGVRYIALDFFDEATNPPPRLPFRAPDKYLPAARSVQKSLEDSATQALMGVASLVETLRKEALSEKIVQTTTDADEVLGQLQQLLRSIDSRSLPQHTAETVDELHEAVARINRVLSRFDGDKGLLSTTQQSVSAIGEAGRHASDTSTNLSETLEEVRSAAEAIRMLADRIERDPDMLIKGRAKDNGP